jgi:hypothetical protein
MGTTYRFLAEIDEARLIIDWFRELPEPPTESRHEDGILLYFEKLGPILEDSKSSPLVNVFLPKKTHGVLTTAGEVHFLASPMKNFPQLADVNRKFRKWLKQYHLVFTRKPVHDNRYDYFLEGSIKNWDSDVYALPRGLKELDKGKYFVSHNDNDLVLDQLCKQLRLRGVEGLK